MMTTKFLAKVAIVGFVIVSIILMLDSIKSMADAQESHNGTKNIELSDEILSYILDLRLENAYIVYAQARLESGNFTSDIFMENNNLFGMKMAERRPTTAIGVNRGHAVYKSWRESVIDYALMQAAYYRGLDEKTYLDKICSVYAEDTTYRKRLEAMKNE